MFEVNGPHLYSVELEYSLSCLFLHALYCTFILSLIHEYQYIPVGNGVCGFLFENLLACGCCGLISNPSNWKMSTLPDKYLV